MLLDLPALPRAEALGRDEVPDLILFGFLKLFQFLWIQLSFMNFHLLGLEFLGHVGNRVLSELLHPSFGCRHLNLHRHRRVGRGRQRGPGCPPKRRLQLGNRDEESSPGAFPDPLAATLPRCSWSIPDQLHLVWHTVDSSPIGSVANFVMVHGSSRGPCISSKPEHLPIGVVQVLLEGDNLDGARPWSRGITTCLLASPVEDQVAGSRRWPIGDGVWPARPQMPSRPNTWPEAPVLIDFPVHGLFQAWFKHPHLLIRIHLDRGRTAMIRKPYLFISS